MPASRRHLKFLWWLDMSVRALVCYGLVYTVTHLLNYIF